MASSQTTPPGSTDTQSAKRSRRKGVDARGQMRMAWLMLAPFVLAYLLFFLWPALQTVRLSFTDSGLTDTKGYVGLANYVQLVADDDFWSALIQTGYFALLTVIPLTALGLVMALLVNRLTRTRAIVQAIFFLPYVLPVAVMTLIFGWLYHPVYGLINAVLGGQRAWLNDVNWAMPSVAIATIWWTVGFNMLLFVAGLKNIPGELYEAATLDGANRWEQFRYITWPQLKPTTSLVFMLQLIASFKIFSQPYILTGGGPFNTTRVVLQYMYEQGFTSQNAGYASAIACAFLLVVLVLALLQAGLTWLRIRRAAR
jgi:multiple sugar transport system permease protein